MPTRPELEDARRRLRKALDEAGTDDVMRRVAEAALGIKKRVRHDFTCKHCGRVQSQQVEISDAVGAATALEKLLNQSNGRPQEEQPDAGVTVNYTVKIVQPEPEDPLGG